MHVSQHPKNNRGLKKFAKGYLAIQRSVCGCVERRVNAKRPPLSAKKAVPSGNLSILEILIIALLSLLDPLFSLRGDDAHNHLPLRVPLRQHNEHVANLLESNNFVVTGLERAALYHCYALAA